MPMPKAMHVGELVRSMLGDHDGRCMAQTAKALSLITKERARYFYLLSPSWSGAIGEGDRLKQIRPGHPVRLFLESVDVRNR